MISVTIEPADNGLIKLIVDDNVNGGGEEHVTRRVYDFEGNEARENQIKFFYELVLDLGMDIGTDLDSDKITISKTWGTKYKPSKEELIAKISELQQQIEKLGTLNK